MATPSRSRNVFEIFDNDSGSDFNMSNYEENSDSDSEDCVQPLIHDVPPPAPTPDNESDSDSDQPRLVDTIENDRLNWFPVIEEDTLDNVDFIVRGNVGPTALPEGLSEPMDFFRLFLTRGLVTEMVRQTNLYARQFLSSDQIMLRLQNHKHSRYHKWTDVTSADIEKYLGLIFQMGTVRKKVINDYWSTEPGDRTPFFGETMPLWKFLLIRRMFHLNNKDTEIPRNTEGFDPWAKIRLVLDHMNLVFKRFYKPSSNVSIDESMVGMKNKTVYIQYLKNKRHSRFGIKKFELCDSNGYVLHVALYAGKDFDLRCREGQAHAVVIELMTAANLLNKGYHLFTDRFYTRPALALDLFKHKTLLTGTVLHNAKGMPAGMNKKLAVGESVYMRKGPMLAVAFREKQSQQKPVVLLSTGHKAKNDTKEIRGRQKTKPEMNFSYNKYMGGVDLADKKLYHYASERATHRYWTKIFANLLDIAMLNSFEIYKLSVPTPATKKRYIQTIIYALCGSGRRPQPTPPSTPTRPHTPTPSTSTPTRPSTPVPSIPAHTLERLPGKKESDCAVCSKPKARKRSRMWCPICQVGVHKTCEAQFSHPGTKRPNQPEN